MALSKPNSASPSMSVPKGITPKYTHLANICENHYRGDQDNRLLIDHIELLRNGSRSSTDAEEGGSGLGDQVRGGREFLNDLRGAF